MTPQEYAEKAIKDWDSTNLKSAISGIVSEAIAAAVQAEREACAKIAEEIGHAPKFRDGRPADWIQITAAIRARSEAKS